MQIAIKGTGCEYQVGQLIWELSCLLNTEHVYNLFCFSESWDYSTVVERRSLHRSQTHSEWIAITPLIPMSSYVIQVNASNSVGYILSNVQTVDLEPGCKYCTSLHTG